MFYLPIDLLHHKAHTSTVTGEGSITLPPLTSNPESGLELPCAIVSTSLSPKSDRAETRGELGGHKSGPRLQALARASQWRSAALVPGVSSLLPRSASSHAQSVTLVPSIIKLALPLPAFPARPASSCVQLEADGPGPAQRREPSRMVGCVFVAAADRRHDLLCLALSHLRHPLQVSMRFPSVSRVMAQPGTALSAANQARRRRGLFLYVTATRAPQLSQRTHGFRYAISNLLPKAQATPAR